MPKQFGPKVVELLVTKAFVLEAITDKPGCTSRYIDLPGKSLQDFLIAGINSSPYFGLLTRDFYKNKKGVFKYNLAALKASNTHKSAKYVNFGLLEVMFAVVSARLKTSNPDNVIDETINVIKQTTNADVMNILKTRQLAWSTSNTPHKSGFKPHQYKNCQSVWQFYQDMTEEFEPDSSNYQWALQYKEGLPILCAFFKVYKEKGEIINTTKTVFEKLKSNYPEVAVGILADMCAAAIFLWLSFNDDQA